MYPAPPEYGLVKLWYLKSGMLITVFALLTQAASVRDKGNILGNNCVTSESGIVCERLRVCLRETKREEERFTSSS